MTRINCIPPGELTRPHLLSEYRELPRAFSLAAAAVAREEDPNDRRNPRAYTLGTGHVRFFYTRLEFLFNRWAELIGEMRARGMHPSLPYKEIYRKTREAVPDQRWWQDWTPTPEAQALCRARIAERLADV